MNTADVAEHLRYTGKHPLLSVYKFIKRHGIVPRHDGRRVLLARADVDRALTNQRRSHAQQSRASDSPRHVNKVAAHV